MTATITTLTEGRPMKITIVIIVLIVAAFFIVPMAVGGSTNVCQALEKHNVSKSAASIAGGNSGPVYGVINSIGQAGATGQTETNIQANAYPNSPTAISCAASFWRSL
jgi:hypothetical protein